MNIRLTVFVLLLLVLCSSGNAQQKQTASKGWRFHSINTVGLVEGQAGGALQVLSVNGVQHGSWFGGIGVGIDNYRLRSIPVFVEVRKALYNKFFAYAGAGVNYYWQRNRDVKQFYTSDRFVSGLYWEAGLGYTLKLHRGLSLLFSGGYSFKKLTEQGYEYWYGPEFANIAPSLSKVNYNLNRLEIKTGIAF